MLRKRGGLLDGELLRRVAMRALSQNSRWRFTAAATRLSQRGGEASETPDLARFGARPSGEPHRRRTVAADVAVILHALGATQLHKVVQENELVDPTVNVTPEIQDEMDEHQVFFTGTAVEGPCNTANPDAVVEHAYGDTDSNEFPIGLMNTFTAKASGTGVLGVLLRHMPPINGEAVKTGTLADVIDSGSSTDLPGSTDIDIEFTVTVE